MMTTSPHRSLAILLALSFVAGCAGRRMPPPDPEPLPIRDGARRPGDGSVHYEPKTVKIGLREAATKVSLQCEGDFLVRDVPALSEKKWPKGDYLITVKSGRIVIAGKSFGDEVRFIPTSEAFPLQSNRATYRGTLIARVDGGTRVTLINELTVDDYLKGVLPREVVPAWAEESLKAQAVASRTYLVSHLGRHNSNGFDLCSDVHCQVYGGVDREHPRTTAAVAATEGEILVHAGKPISAFFHSNCGGQTERPGPVWGMADTPYLPSKACRYGGQDPRYVWSLVLSDDEIMTALKRSTDVRGDVLESISVKSKSTSGRAAFVTVETDRGRFTVNGNKFRLALHPGRLRSTLWTRMTRTRRGYRFEGRGWGHGVGMCQWGAKGQADLNRSYRTILSFYYPGSTLTLWTDR